MTYNIFDSPLNVVLPTASLTETSCPVTKVLEYDNAGIWVTVTGVSLPPGVNSFDSATDTLEFSSSDKTLHNTVIQFRYTVSDPDSIDPSGSQIVTFEATYIYVCAANQITLSAMPATPTYNYEPTATTQV